MKPPNVWQTAHTPFGRQGLIDHVSRNSGSVSRKRRELPARDKFGSFTLNQPVCMVRTSTFHVRTLPYASYATAIESATGTRVQRATPVNAVICYRLPWLHTSTANGKACSILFLFIPVMFSPVRPLYIRTPTHVQRPHSSH